MPQLTFSKHLRLLFEYIGYNTAVEYGQESCCFHGKIDGIADLVTFEGESPQQARGAFEEAVDDYLEFLKLIESKKTSENKHP